MLPQFSRFLFGRQSILRYQGLYCHQARAGGAAGRGSCAGYQRATGGRSKFLSMPASSKVPTWVSLKPRSVRRPRAVPTTSRC